MSVHAKDVAIERERAAKLFGECSTCGGLLDCGFCPDCKPAEHARSRALADEEAKRREEQRRHEYAEAHKPIAAMADLIEQRPNASNYASLVKALREGYATELQLRLARRLTKKKRKR